jgi:Flp pilus assembly pilin Flp
MKLDMNLEMSLLKQSIRKFWKDEDGLGTLEILLIVAVLVIIAVAFRKWIMKWVLEMFNATQTQVTDQSTSITTDATSISP